MKVIQAVQDKPHITIFLSSNTMKVFLLWDSAKGCYDLILNHTEYEKCTKRAYIS